MAPTLGQRLGKLRQSRKWTQSEVAQRLRVTAAAVSAYERDANQPSLEVLKRLAALYGVSADFLLGIDNAAAPERARQGEELASRLQQLARDFAQYMRDS